METKKYFKRNNVSGTIIEVVGKHESGDYLCLWLFSEGEPFRYHYYEFEKEFIEIDSSEVEKLERHSCPRRLVKEDEDFDYWEILNNGDKICSYCGSLHPDSILEIVKKHGIKAIERTDKDYKWYIRRPDVKNALEGGIKYYRQHDTKEFIDELNKIIKEQNGN